MKQIVKGKLVLTKWGLMLEHYDKLIPLYIPIGFKWQDFSDAMKVETEFKVFYRLWFPHTPRGNNFNWTLIEADSLRDLKIKINITWLQITKELDIEESKAKARGQEFDRPDFVEFNLNQEKAYLWIRRVVKNK